MAPPDRPAPRVSVAISTYNRAHLVGRAIRSALAQTAGDFELIVVDDGSADDTQAVLAAVGDSRLHIARHERNQGISRTRNTALGLARGEWIAFLDDDNEWVPEYLERQLALAAARPEAGVVYCRAHLQYPDRPAVEWGEVWQGRIFCRLLGGWAPLMSGALIRTAALAAVGGLDERLRATEDRDLWLRLAQRTDFAATPDVLLIRHEGHGAQLSRNPELFARDVAVLHRSWRTAVTAACGRRAYRRWLLGLVEHTEWCHAERARAAGARERAIAAAARSVVRLLRWLPWSAALVPRVLWRYIVALYSHRVGRAFRRPAAR
jgi:glycosyltransferase involved in cell wall biosynthesis